MHWLRRVTIATVVCCGCGVMAAHHQTVLGQLAISGPQSRNAEHVGEDASSISFHPVVVCDTFAGGYQVAVADLNGDGKPDIVGLGEHPGTVDWFENPGQVGGAWPRHPISGQLTARNIDVAVHDVDGNGQLDLAVAGGFDLSNSDRDGSVDWLYRESDRGQEWAAVRIHVEPTAHRIRWADVDGDGRNELITVPIVGRGARQPGLQEAAARLTCRWIPRDPLHDAWPEQIIDQSLTVAHGVCIIDWDGDGRDELLTASNQGIHLFKAHGDRAALRWSRTHLAAGHLGRPPQCGASEVCVGRTTDGKRFLATVEPWHGNEVVVYTPPAPDAVAPALWERKVIDDSLRAGHALCRADLDGDGGDEIVAGYRGEGTSLHGYRLTRTGSEHWERFVIDADGIAAQGCVAADVNGDGRIDLVATGGSTHNVKLYVNTTKHTLPTPGRQ